MGGAVNNPRIGKDWKELPQEPLTLSSGLNIVGTVGRVLSKEDCNFSKRSFLDKRGTVLFMGLKRRDSDKLNKKEKYTYIRSSTKEPNNISSQWQSNN